MPCFRGSASPLLVAALLAAWPHRDDRPPEHIDTVADAGHLWKRPGVRRFLLVAMLAQAGFGTFYVFYTLHLQAHHHDGLEVGILWAAGVQPPRSQCSGSAPGLIARFGASRLLSICLAISTVRWAVTALCADSFPILFVAQLTHAFSFAVFQACRMRMMVERISPARARAPDKACCMDSARASAECWEQRPRRYCGNTAEASGPSLEAAH